ncbi:MAG: PAS domain S-box-containing protein [Haloarculaceae archaeon]|jgi:PAS domain S-box-containing protein
MVSVADGYLAAGVLAGGVIYVSGYHVYRMSDRLGRRWFVAFAGLLGFGCLAAGVVALVPWLAPVGEQSSWPQIPLLFWLPSTFPWFLFALQYTGTRTRLRRRVVALLGAPYAVILVDFGLGIIGIRVAVLNVVASAVFIYTISLVVAGVYLLLQTTYSAGHLSVGQGVSLSVVPVGSLAVWNALGTIQDPSVTARAGVFAAGAGLAAAGLGVAIVRYDLFDSTPSIHTLGERALTRETDDLMVVVDDEDRVIRVNQTAVDTLGVSRSDALGQQLADVIDRDTETLRQVKTVQVQTTEGTRQYDPQVTRVTNHYGNDLGAMLSLRDVTDRKLREQRLAVLNRVLRHNLRNQADVVKGHAESLDAEGDRVAPIIDAADSIAALGQQAHRIDQYIAKSPDYTAVDLSDAVQEVLDTVGAEGADVAVSVEIPASARLVTNERALVSALESATENAIKYADSTVTLTADDAADGYVFRIVDDGDGIPEWELDSLDTGTETALQHSTGIGLWQLKWAVMALNGDLSFDTENGTTVEIAVPDRDGGRTRPPDGA